MGKLKPGATYIYERADGVTYAREFGDSSASRFPIGWDSEKSATLNKMEEDKLWGDIRRAAKTNPLLQEELNRVKIFYELSKKDGKK